MSPNSEKKLIILLTRSEFDWGKLHKSMRLYGNPLTVSADTGQVIDHEDTSSCVLSIVKIEDEIQENSEPLVRVISNFPGRNIVIGVHPPSDRRSAPLRTWLDVNDPTIARIARCRRIFKYTTTDGRFTHVIDHIVESINNSVSFAPDFASLWKAFFIPWRYEYFVEVSLRLQSFEDAVNRAIVRKIILGEEPENDQYKDVCDKYETYDQDSDLDEIEARLFSELQEVIIAFTESLGNKDPLSWDAQHQQQYDRIYRLLSRLSERERQEHSGQIPEKELQEWLKQIGNESGKFGRAVERQPEEYRKLIIVDDINIKPIIDDILSRSKFATVKTEWKSSLSELKRELDQIKNPKEGIILINSQIKLRPTDYRFQFRGAKLVRFELRVLWKIQLPVIIYSPLGRGEFLGNIYHRVFRNYSGNHLYMNLPGDLPLLPDLMGAAEVLSRIRREDIESHSGSLTALIRGYKRDLDHVLIRSHPAVEDVTGIVETLSSLIPKRFHGDFKIAELLTECENMKKENVAAIQNIHALTAGYGNTLASLSRFSHWRIYDEL
ncbi:MAG: hypothetical protein JST85_22420 [Acidobacteria bacterium]|nr:hypothetical protein [Acidobacteriota bacterium]